MNHNFHNIDIVILCGGKGTRLLPVVSDRPKGLAAFGDSTFLDILIDSLKKYGFRRFVLCVGHMKEQIIEHFQSRNDILISFSEEDVPLGTGGALKKAQSLIQSETFIVMNGDSICDINYQDFYQSHMNKNAMLSMALVRTKETHDFGSVVINNANEIISFKEKIKSHDIGLINAGIYLMQKDIFSHMPDNSEFSLEHDFFPDLAGQRCAGFIVNGELIDIGTPDRYKNAVQLIGGGK
ncbi:nucleotidyltransferase family protein [uncultured Methanoregula sp.]|uniref:nucleotidyltransferase family protein n=1 Tax=uncultured Methanoregula sp. TaxID=1005933 RepID=UPI002AAAE1F5|nr:nucleotidyltransferase family protein [uncultured Methanoregula sp.]